MKQTPPLNAYTTFSDTYPVDAVVVQSVANHHNFKPFNTYLAMYVEMLPIGPLRLTGFVEKTNDDKMYVVHLLAETPAGRAYLKEPWFDFPSSALDTKLLLMAGGHG